MSGKRKVEQGGATPGAGGGEMHLVPAGFSTGAAIPPRRRTSTWRSPTGGWPPFHHDTPVTGSVSLGMSLVSLRGCWRGKKMFPEVWNAPAELTTTTASQVDVFLSRGDGDWTRSFSWPRMGTVEDGCAGKEWGPALLSSAERFASIPVGANTDSFHEKKIKNIYIHTKKPSSS